MEQSAVREWPPITRSAKRRCLKLRGQPKRGIRMKGKTGVTMRTGQKKKKKRMPKLGGQAGKAQKAVRKRKKMLESI